MGFHFVDSLMVAVVGLLVVFFGLTVLIVLIKIMCFLTRPPKTAAPRTCPPVHTSTPMQMPPDTSDAPVKSSKIRVR